MCYDCLNVSLNISSALVTSTASRVALFTVEHQRGEMSYY